MIMSTFAGIYDLGDTEPTIGSTRTRLG